MDETKDTFAPEDGAQNNENEANRSAAVNGADEAEAQASTDSGEQTTAEETATGTAESGADEGEQNDAADSTSNASTQFEFGTPEKSDDEAAKTTEASESKKGFLYTPIFAALIIVAVAALALLVVKCFFDNSIEGTWLYAIESESSSADEASSDEASTLNVYYVFNNDKTFECVIGTLTQYGTYSVGTDEETGEATVTLTSTSSETELYYSISGNVFTGKTLVLASESATSSDSSTNFEMKSASLPEIKLEVSKDFTPNEALIGKWTYDDPYYGYSYSYTFYEDGTAVISQAISGESDMLRANGTYTYTDDTIVITYYYNDETEMEITYEVTDDGLALNELEYTKDTGESTTTAAETEAEATTAAAE